MREWSTLTKSNGREHTVRLGDSVHDMHVNGINGVAGMQYINSSHGREIRERNGGAPEPTEKLRSKVSRDERKVYVDVKAGERIAAGEELRIHYGWDAAAWREATSGVVSEQHTQGWTKGDSRGAGEWRNVIENDKEPDSSMDEDEVIRIYQAKARVRVGAIERENANKMEWVDVDGDAVMREVYIVGDGGAKERERLEHVRRPQATPAGSSAQHAMMTDGPHTCENEGADTSGTMTVVESR